MIGLCFTCIINDGVVMFTAKHACSGRTRSKFNGTNGGNGKYDVTNERFNRVEEGLAQTNWQTSSPAFNNAANRILCINGFL